MKKNLDSEENYQSKTAEGVLKNGQKFVRIMKRLCFADRSFCEL